MEVKKKRAVLVSAECIQTAKQKLTELGKENSGMVNKRAAVKSVKAQIKAARARGCGWAEIIETLSAAGIDISLRTLKTEVETGNEKPEQKKSKKETKANMEKAKEVKSQAKQQQVFSGGNDAHFAVEADDPNI